LIPSSGTATLEAILWLAARQAGTHIEHTEQSMLQRRLAGVCRFILISATCGRQWQTVLAWFWFVK